MTDKTAGEKHYAIRLRKFTRICPITGFKEEAIRVGAPVIIQTDRGIEYGEIVKFDGPIPRLFLRDIKLKKVIRYATVEDLEKVKALAGLEKKAIETARQKVKENTLPVRILDIEYLFDNSRMLVYYKTGEGEKVKNIRDLSHELTTTLKIRADLHQISARDAARYYGGVGPCGRSLCCSVWLEKPRQVTVKMVKEQNISLSPTKTSGLCGRLMCCLSYEL